MAWWRGMAIAAAAAFWLAAGAVPAMAGPEEEVAALIEQTNALRDAGKDGEARAFAEKALALAEQAFGPDSEKLARPLRSLGAIHLRAAASGGGDWAKAESLLKRSLAAREKNPDGVKPDLGEALLALAMAYSIQKKLDELDGYFDRYVAHAEARIAAGKLRPDDPDLAKALTVQWGDYLTRGRIAELQRRFQRMIALSEQSLGYGHPYTGVLVFQLAAGMDLLQGPFGGSVPVQPLYERYVTIAQKALADTSADSGPSVTRDDLMAKLNRAADRLMAAGKQDKAQEALAAVRRAREAAPQQPQPLAAETSTVPDVLARQADDAEKQGTRADALPLRKRLFLTRQQAFAANPGDARARAGLVEACQRLADYYFETDLVNDAEPMFKCVLLVREMEGDKLKIGDALDKMGSVYDRLGRFAEAEEVLKRAIVLIEEAKGADTTDASPIRIRVAGLMAKQGRAEEGAKFAMANAAANTKLFARPPGVRNALADLDNWGTDPGAQARYSVMEWRSMEMDHKVTDLLGADSPNIVEPFAQTAALFQFSKDWANAVGYLDRAAKVVIASLKRGGGSGAAREDDIRVQEYSCNWRRRGGVWRRRSRLPGRNCETIFRDGPVGTALRRRGRACANGGTSAKQPRTRAPCPRAAGYFQRAARVGRGPAGRRLAACRSPPAAGCQRAGATPAAGRD